MPPIRRFFLRLHVKLCVFCGKYNRQVMDSQDMCRCYKEARNHQRRDFRSLPSPDGTLEKRPAQGANRFAVEVGESAHTYK